MVLRFPETRVKEYAIQFNKFREKDSMDKMKKLINQDIYRSYAVQLSDSEHMLDTLLKVILAYCVIRNVEYQ